MGEMDRTRTRNVADLTCKKVPDILTMFKKCSLLTYRSLSYGDLSSTRYDILITLFLAGLLHDLFAKKLSNLYDTDLI